RAPSAARGSRAATCRGSPPGGLGGRRRSRPARGCARGRRAEPPRAPATRRRVGAAGIDSWRRELAAALGEPVGEFHERDAGRACLLRGTEIGGAQTTKNRPKPREVHRRTSELARQERGAVVDVAREFGEV